MQKSHFDGADPRFSARLDELEGMGDLEQPLERLHEPAQKHTRRKTSRSGKHLGDAWYGTVFAHETL